MPKDILNNNKIQINQDEINSLKSDLDKLKDESDQMFPNEIITTEGSTFQESFPNFKYNNDFLNMSLKMKEDEVLNSALEIPAVRDVLKPVIDNPQFFVNNVFENNIKSYQDLERGIINKFNNEDQITIKKLNIPGLSDDLLYKDLSTNKFYISMEKISSITTTPIMKYIQNMDTIDVATLIGLGGIELLSYTLLYKWINKNFSSTAFYTTEELKKINTNDLEILRYGEQKNHIVRQFKGGPALLITTSVFIIGHTLANSFSNNTILYDFLQRKLKDSIEIATSNKESGIIPFILAIKKKKGGTFLMYFIILVLVVFFLIIFSSHILYIFSFFKSFRFLYFTYVIVLGFSFFILYHLTTMFILIKFSILKDEKIHISKYWPKVIQDYLLNLKQISQFKSLSLFLDLHIKTVLYLLFFLIIYLFVIFIFV